MRKPRQPRLPRETRTLDPSAIPPPGFSVPFRSFGAGPQPPRRFAPTAPPAAPVAAAAAPTPMPAPGPEPPVAPAAAPMPPPQAQATNAWTENVQHRDWQQQRSPRRPIPQGETALIHAWAQAVGARHFPPQACTLWLRRVDPQPIYEMWIPGEAVAGDHPDRALYEYAMANRRGASVAERFVGRIQAPTHDGSVVEIGGGELYLPPAPPAPPAAPWGPPQGSAAPPWSSGGGWGMPPWWAGPGAMGGMAGGPPGLPPWWGPSPMAAQMAAAVTAAQPPPAAVQSDPNSLRMWQQMQEANQAMTKQLFEFAFNRATAPAPAAPASAAVDDPWKLIDRVFSLQERIRSATPAAPAERPQIQVLRVDDDTTLVTNKDGDIDASATAWANLKGAKGIISALRGLRQTSPAQGQGPQPPKRVGLPAANGAAKPS